MTQQLSKFSACVFLVLTMVFVTLPVHAATVTVTTGGDGASGCTLRRAIESVNQGLALGSCSAIGMFGQEDRVNFSLTSGTAIQLLSSHIAVYRSVHVDGPGADLLTIVPKADERVFNVSGSSEFAVDVVIERLRFAGAANTNNGGVIGQTGSKSSLTLSDTVFENNRGSNGGVLQVNGIDQLTILGSHFRSNQADEYGAVLWAFGVNTISISASEFADNQALINPQVDVNTGFQGGGAVFLISVAKLTIDDSSFYRNGFAQLNPSGEYAAGGAIFMVQITDAKLQGLEFEENYAYNGGAVLAGSVSGRIAVTEFNSNTASENGGAVGLAGIGSNQSLIFNGNSFFDNAASNGGAVYADSGLNAVITNTTFIENSATSIGGAIKANDDGIAIKHATFVGNTAQDSGGAIDASGAELSLDNSILMGNRADNDGADLNAVGANFVSFDNNIIGDSGVSKQDSFSGIFPPPTNLFATSDSQQPLTLEQVLQPLVTDNVTDFYVPVERSIAIDAARANLCPLRDQRQSPRNDINCDIGAIEFQLSDRVIQSVLYTIPLANGRAVVFEL